MITECVVSALFVIAGLLLIQVMVDAINKKG